jgi:hypothetical protein
VRAFTRGWARRRRAAQWQCPWPCPSLQRSGKRLLAVSFRTMSSRWHWRRF